MPKRTDHSSTIRELRDLATELDRLFKATGREAYNQDAVSSRAAADLLELHDAASINLHNAPGLMAFVKEMVKVLIGRTFYVHRNNA